MSNFTASIAASADDYLHNSTGAFDATASLLYVGEEPSVARTDHFVLWFDNVTIPQGATITSATMAFRTTTNTVGTGTLLTKIAAVDEDDPAAATDAATCATDDGILTSAQTDWDFTLIDADDNALTTANFAAVIQEIVNRPGWASGNALLIRVGDDGNTDKYQAVAAYDHASYAAPSISIDFEPPGGFGWGRIPFG